MAAPIGVFDSGVGGLTVLKAMRESMPGEDFIYLGDTARLPYGTKSRETVIRYSLQCAAALIARDIRCLVVACNTASASSLDALRLKYPSIPVIGVIEPGAAAAVTASASQYIAVIATEGTIDGGAYTRAIRILNPGARIAARACALFVAMAEEGWNEGPVAEAVARRYLDPVFRPDPQTEAVDGRPDTLVLGCTHFPVLVNAIRSVVPEDIRIVDSAVTTAAVVRRTLHAGSELVHGGRGRVTWLATDGAARFARIGGLFLGEPLRAGAVEIIDL